MNARKLYKRHIDNPDNPIVEYEEEDGSGEFEATIPYEEIDGKNFFDKITVIQDLISILKTKGWELYTESQY
jgi:hypothetical protein